MELTLIKESLDIICSTSDGYNMYAKFEMSCYEVMFEPKIKV